MPVGLCAVRDRKPASDWALASVIRSLRPCGPDSPTVASGAWLRPVSQLFPVVWPQLALNVLPSEESMSLSNQRSPSPPGYVSLGHTPASEAMTRVRAKRARWLGRTSLLELLHAPCAQRALGGRAPGGHGQVSAAQRPGRREDPGHSRVSPHLPTTACRSPIIKCVRSEVLVSPSSACLSQLSAAVGA